MKTSHRSDNQPTAENVQEAGRGAPLPRLVRASLFGMIRLAEWGLLILDGWRPFRTMDRTHGRVWFWKSKKRDQVLCREIAYEIAAMDYRPNTSVEAHP